MKRFCKQCGNEIEEGLNFCENCGYRVESQESAAPSPELPPPPPPPPQIRNSKLPPPAAPLPPAIPPSPKAAKRKGGGKSCVTILLILLGLALCAGAAFGLITWGGDKLAQLQNVLPGGLPALAADTPVRVYPSTTPEKKVYPSSTPDSRSSVNSFEYDFAKEGRAWEEATNSKFGKGYNSAQGCYVMTVYTDNTLIYSRAPLPFKKPYKNMAVNFIGRPVNGESMTYGVLFGMKDNKNFYYVGISRNFLTVKRMVNGQKTVLTNPEWKEIVDYNPNQDGTLSVSVVFQNNTILVKIGNTDQVFLKDTDLSEGDVALFVDSSGVSGGGSNYGDVFGHANFDYFSAYLLK